MRHHAWGANSRAQLDTCHPLLVEVLDQGLFVSPMDMTVLQGWRNEADQMAAYNADPPRSKVPWPEGKHNHTATEEDVRLGFATEVGQPLSLAADVAPWHPTAPNIRWEREGEFRFLAGIIVGVSYRILRPHGFMARWGGDWDGDGDLFDQEFMDLGHMEIVRLTP